MNSTDYVEHRELHREAFSTAPILEHGHPDQLAHVNGLETLGGEEAARVGVPLFTPAVLLMGVEGAEP